MSDETRVTLYRWREGNDRHVWHVARGGPIKSGRPAPSEEDAEVQEFVPARALEEPSEEAIEAARAALLKISFASPHFGGDRREAAEVAVRAAFGATLAVLSGGEREGRGSDG